MSQSNPSRKQSSKPSGSDLIHSKSSYDANFEQNMIDNGIYPHNEASMAQNVKDVRGYLRGPRASLSSSHFGDNDVNEFKKMCNKEKDEAGVRAEIVPIIAGEGRK